MKTRAEIRDRIKILLESTLVNDLDIVVEVFGHLPVHPGGISPYVGIIPLSSDPTGSTKKRSKREHVFGVYSFVMYASAVTNVDEEAAWAVADAVHEGIVDVIVSNNYHKGYWTSITYVEPSTIEPVPIDNQGYLIEVLPIRVLVA